MNKTKKIFIRTFGCQMNEHDSEKITLMLCGHGYAPVTSPKDADLILYNTCTIREKAHHKAMSEIGRSRVYKKKRKDVLIGVCGCVAQEEKGAIIARYPHVDILFGPDQIHKLPELIKNAEQGVTSTALDLINDESEYVFLSGGFDASRFTLHASRSSFFISIIKGCNCACSYCIVPSVRGREVCRNPKDILAEINSLVQRGTKEVVLLGQNVNSYSRGQETGDRGQGKATTFSQLLRMISDETGIERIRFTSPHPRDVGEDLIQEYAENLKLMPHIHLPVQSGSNAVLKKMRRGYTREHYLKIAAELKAARKGFSITTDIIVGFCGETEKDYSDTLDLMHEADFDSSFAFKYSPRPGTEAAKKLDDDVPLKEKEERLDKLLTLQRDMTLKNNTLLVGLKSMALVNSKDVRHENFLTGRLPDNRIIHFAGKDGLIGSIVEVKITKANANSLTGELT